MGQIQLIRAYRMDSGDRDGPVQPRTRTSCSGRSAAPRTSSLGSSGLFIEMMIHQIDECCWIKDAWPVAAHGVGGRAANSTGLQPEPRQLLDRVHLRRRHQGAGDRPLHAQLLQRVRHLRPRHEVRGAVLRQHPRADGAHLQGPARSPADNIAWKPRPEKVNPWQAEWNVLLDAIRNDRPHNEAQRAAYSNLAAIMGRAAVHSGKIVTWDEMMASKFQFCPNVDGLTTDSPAPVQADAQGRYPAPVPGGGRRSEIWTCLRGGTGS